MLLEQFLTSESAIMALARFAATLIGGFIFTRIVIMPLTRILASRKVETVTTQASIENITGIFFGIMSLSLALQISGYGGLVTLLGTVTAALTVAIGFGMREEVGSLVSGFFIKVDRPFITGDYIATEKTRGIVSEINMRSTVLKNVESDKVVVPNRVLTSDAVKNYTKGRKTRASVEIKGPVQHQKTIQEVLEETAKQHEKVNQNPKPESSIETIEDGKAVIQLKCYVDNSKLVEQTRSDILEEFSNKKKIKDIFSEKKKE